MITESHKLPLKWHGLIDLAGKDIAPMTERQSELFLNLSMAEMTAMNNEKIHATFSVMFSYQVLNRRLEIHGSVKNISPAVQAFTAGISNSPGDAVMWAFTLAYMAAVEKKPITLGVFADYFPWGIPTEEARDRVWDAQKQRTPADGSGTDNMVDDFSNWPRAE